MNIFETTPIMIIPNWYMALTFAISAILSLAGLFLFLYEVYGKKNREKPMNKRLASGILVFLILFLCGSLMEDTMYNLAPRVESGKYQYVAQLEEGASMENFFENYDNIEYLGNNVYSFTDKTK